MRQALLADGWRITHDPPRLRWGKRDLYVDLGAEDLLAAEKDRREIAVEIKRFLDVRNKDRAATLWVESATALAGQSWRYAKVRQTDFQRLPPTTFAERVHLAAMGQSRPA